MTELFFEFYTHHYLRRRTSTRETCPYQPSRRLRHSRQRPRNRKTENIGGIGHVIERGVRPGCWRDTREISGQRTFFFTLAPVRSAGVAGDIPTSFDMAASILSNFLLFQWHLDLESPPLFPPLSLNLTPDSLSPSGRASAKTLPAFLIVTAHNNKISFLEDPYRHSDT